MANFKKAIATALHTLEQEFARIATRMRRESDYSWTSYDPSEDLVQTLVGCRHSEFAPLLIQAIDCLPAKGLKQDLIRTLYDSFSSPRDGFAVLYNYLASPQPAAAADIFEYWTEHDQAHQESGKRQVELEKSPKPRAAGADETAIREAALADEHVMKFVGSRTAVKRVIVVPGRQIANVVVSAPAGGQSDG